MSHQEDLDILHSAKPIAVNNWCHILGLWQRKLPLTELTHWSSPRVCWIFNLPEHQFLLHGIGTAVQHERLIFVKIGIQKPNAYICLFIKDTHYFVKSRKKEGYLNFNSNLHAVTKHTWLQERKHNILINWLLSQWMLYCQKTPVTVWIDAWELIAVVNGSLFTYKIEVKRQDILRKKV